MRGRKLVYTMLVSGLYIGLLCGQALGGPGSCEHVAFPYNSQGEVDWPYIVKVLRQDSSIYQDAGSSSVIGSLDFNQNVSINDVQGNRVQIQRVKTGEILGWAERSDLLCALSPLKGKSNLEQKFYIQTATEVRKDTPASVSAYPSADRKSCQGKCRELSRFSGYFVFDVDETNGKSYLLSETYKVDDSTPLVGWVSDEHGFIWDTAYGVRPKENLVFPEDHEKAGQERAVCAYDSLEDALTDPIGKCLPILGGDRWYLSDLRIPILERVESEGKEFYKVVLPLAGTGATYEKESGTIKIIEPGQFTANPGVESLTGMKHIDVVFLIDGTKSLRHHIEEIKGDMSTDRKGLVQEIVDALKKDDSFQEAQFRFGFRIYRDEYARDKELGEGFSISSQCELSYDDLESNLRSFQQQLDQIQVSEERRDDYPENLFGGINRAVRDLSPCPDNTKILFVIGDCGYDEEAQKRRGRTPVKISSLVRKLKGQEGIKNIVTFFIQTPKEAGAARHPDEYERAYRLFSQQARDILTQILGPGRSGELENYFMVSDARNVNQKILAGIKQFSNTEVINELVVDLRGGTALKDAIERLKGDQKYHNIPGLFWDLIEQGSCQKLGEQCRERIYDTILEGYIPISDDLIEDVWLKSDDFDKFTGLLRDFDPQKLVSLSGSQLRESFVYTMTKSLENVIRKPVYEKTGEQMQVYLKRKGGLPVSDTSPLFRYSIDDLNDPESVPDCELVRLVNWVNGSKQMLNIIYHGDLRPEYKVGYAGECPSGDHIPYIDGDVQQVPLGNNPDMRYDHKFQKARVYWVPKVFLP